MSHSGQMRFLSRMGQTTEFCYVGESIQLQIVEAELDGTAFTTATSTRRHQPLPVRFTGTAHW